MKEENYAGLVELRAQRSALWAKIDGKEIEEVGYDTWCEITKKIGELDKLEADLTKAEAVVKSAKTNRFVAIFKAIAAPVCYLFIYILSIYMDNHGGIVSRDASEVKKSFKLPWL